MKKLVFTVILFFPIVLNAQFLHFGARSFICPYSQMEFNEFQEGEFAFYFSNVKNETISFSGNNFEGNEFSSAMVPFPNLFIKYNWKNNWFTELEFFGYRFKNEVQYQNSVDYIEYVATFNPVGQKENTGWNDIEIQWTFGGGSFNIGYSFFKSKALRPYLYTGLTTLVLTQYEQMNADTMRALRSKIIFEGLNTFKRRTHHLRIGAGFEYHGFTISYTIQNSIGDIGTVSKMANKTKPYYAGYYASYITIGLNLYSLNLVSNKTKKKVEKLTE